jgi:hypothetical protein
LFLCGTVHAAQKLIDDLLLSFKLMLLGRPTSVVVPLKTGYSKVDCLGERLTCVGKTSGFWNTFSFNIMINTCKIPWGTPCSWAAIWGASSLTQFYTKMSFKILNFFQRKSVFLQSNLLYNKCYFLKDFDWKHSFAYFSFFSRKIRKGVYIIRVFK